MTVIVPFEEHTSTAAPVPFARISLCFCIKRKSLVLEIIFFFSILDLSAVKQQQWKKYGMRLVSGSQHSLGEDLQNIPSTPQTWHCSQVANTNAKGLQA